MLLLRTRRRGGVRLRLRLRDEYEPLSLDLDLDLDLDLVLYIDRKGDRLLRLLTGDLDLDLERDEIDLESEKLGDLVLFLPLPTSFPLRSLRESSVEYSSLSLSLSYFPLFFGLGEGDLREPRPPQPPSLLSLALFSFSLSLFFLSQSSFLC